MVETIALRLGKIQPAEESSLPDISSSCPLCKSRASSLFEKQGFIFCCCHGCHYRWVKIGVGRDHVTRVYCDEYFQGGGAGYSDYVSEGPILRAHGRRYGRLLSRHIRPGLLLDVGTAAGFILKGFCDKGWSGRGIEPNLRMVEYACSRLGLRVIAGTLENMPRRDRYDVVSMIQVLSHFIDVSRALEAAAELTRPGGLWLIETWNPESWPARLFGRYWHAYSPPSVLHWFSPAGLKDLAARFGFLQIEQGTPSKWINSAHAKSLLRFHSQHAWWGQLPTRMAGAIPDYVTIRYPANDIYWTLFRKA
jgi:SAM-dependent methyltransferase